jgi:hypothetical protein
MLIQEPTVFRLPARHAKLVAFLPLGVATVGVGLLFGSELNTDAAPCGIISLELAGTSNAAADILASWQQKFGSLDPAVRSLALDSFLFIPLYASSLAVGCLWVRDQLPGDQRIVRRLLTVLAWGQLGAAVLDCSENAAMWVMLQGPVVAPWPQLAKWSAVPKFCLVILALLCILSGFVAVGVHGITRRLRS